MPSGDALASARVSVPIADLAPRVLEGLAAAVFAARPDGVLCYLNGEARRLLQGMGRGSGESVEDLYQALGLHDQSTAAPLKFDSFPLQRALLGREIARECWLMGRTDGQFPVETRAMPLLDVRGNVELALLMIEDSRPASGADLLQRPSQMMEQIAPLAGGVAHELNNVLTAIVSFTEFALDSIDAEAPARNDLLEVLKAAGRAEDLTNKLLAFAGQKNQAEKTADLCAVLRSIEPKLRGIASDGCVLELQLPETPLVADLDGASIEDLISNLVANAREAVNKGSGRIRIKVSLLPSGVERDGFVAKSPLIMIEVADDGPGMDRETQARAFEPFFSTKPKGQGVGLGLPSCMGIVSRAGGKIRLHSAPESGTTVTIYIPARHTVDVRSVGASPARRERGLNCETILLIEDDHQVRALAARSLVKGGFRVVEAADATEALAVLERPGAEIDMLVSDVVINGLSGPEIVERVRRDRPQIPVMLMSGYPYEVLKEQGGLDPGVRLLKKPFLPADIVTAVREVLGQNAV